MGDLLEIIRQLPEWVQTLTSIVLVGSVAYLLNIHTVKKIMPMVEKIRADFDTLKSGYSSIMTRDELLDFYGELQRYSSEFSLDPSRMKEKEEFERKIEVRLSPIIKDEIITSLKNREITPDISLEKLSEIYSRLNQYKN